MEKVSVVGWGRTTEGQLGLGGIEETTITQPRSLKALQHVRIKQIACGHAHTVFLTDRGEVLSCGSNEKGQCGQDVSSTRPAHIESLTDLGVVQVACGHSHSLAVTAGGLLYAWGSNEHGQLGVASVSHLSQPQAVEDLSRLGVLQVACGGHHNLALVNSGRLFSWGSNRYGQLGLRASVLTLSTPQEVVALLGLPILHIAAGDAHSMVVSVSGTVFGWGRNTFGQLGVGHEKDISEPTELTTLQTQRVRYVACGETHSAALTEDGGLFTFGSSRFGQLGHNANSTHSTTYPTKVFELMGSTVTQVACGRCHTLALVPSSGRLYGFGLGSSGQLGVGLADNMATPTLVQGCWLNRDHFPSLPLDMEWKEEEGKEREEAEVEGEEREEKEKEEGEEKEREERKGEKGEERDEGEARGPAIGMVVRMVFAGGDHSFASLVVPGEQDGTVIGDCRRKHVSCLPPSINYDVIKKVMDEALITKDYSHAARFLRMVFSHPALLNSSFLSSDHAMMSRTRGSGVDVEETVRTMALLRQRLDQLESTDIRTSNVQLQSALENMLKRVMSQRLLSPESVRLYLVLPAFILQPPLYTTLYAVFAYSLTNLESEWSALVGRWLYDSPLSYLQLWLDSAKQSLSDQLQSKKSEASQNKYPIDYQPSRVMHSMVDLQRMLALLKCMHEWNTRHGEVLAHTQFYVPAVNHVIDFVEDFFNWINPKENPGAVVYCQYPFLLDSRAKAELLKVESRVQMHIAVNYAQTDFMRRLFSQQMIHDPSPLAFKLVVDRANLMQDTLNSLVSTDPRNFKKPLQVEFVGEEGMDAGGVQKEFFMLLLRDILNPQFGMFHEDEESKLVWFSDEPLSYGSLNYFKLVGIVCGLAIYNSVIIDLPFPTALYKKLLKKPTDLSDLKQLHPSVGANLESLLSYDGTDFEDTFSLTFELTRSSFGEVVTVPLVPSGSAVPVTLDNRAEYVQAYVRYVLDVAVNDPFMAFDEGFRRVCDGKVLALLHPLELLSLVAGQQIIEWTELEKYMDYKNGYHSNHPVIRLFWSVFYDLPLDAKKKFLVFWTGCYRIPIAGVESMKMMIQRMYGGRDCERLPVAHTCFNVLDLPPYPSYDHMKQKLLQAINFTSGFGII